MIKIIAKPITLEELKKLAHKNFTGLTKAVADIELELIAAGGEYHADEEAILLEHGSKQKNLWGINIHFENPREDIVEFDSMINIRPSQNNRSRGVENAEIRKKIVSLVNKLIS